MHQCPHCGKSVFKAVIKRPGLIDLSGDEVVIKKEITTEFAYEVVQCANKECAAKLTNEELVSKIPCSSCKKEFDAPDLIQGMCYDCFMEAHPEIKKLNKVQLLKKLLELQGENPAPAASASTAPIEPKKEENKEEPKKEELKKEETPKAGEENTANTEKTTTRRRRRVADTPADTPNDNAKDNPVEDKKENNESQPKAEAAADNKPKEEIKEEPKKESAPAKEEPTAVITSPPEFDDDFEPF